jgi:hypothetical protein
MLSFSGVSLLLLSLAAAAVAAESGNGSTLTRKTPFAPEGGAATAQAAANEVVEFVGTSYTSAGNRTELIFVDKTAKKNYWIAKGETKEGITVLNYDAKREEAVVTINGAQKTLPLRQPTTAKPGAPVRNVQPVQVGFNVAPQPTPLPTVAATTMPAPVTPAAVQPAPVAPTPTPANKPETPSTPEAVAKAETEARMLVSDLLEIGMAQRKAYEEAQRKAAEGKTEQTQPATTQPAQTPEQPKQ